MDKESDVPEVKQASGCCGVACFFLKHSCREVCRRMCYFVISLASCFLAILVALIANTIIAQAPLLFLKISEITQGEVDIVLAPSDEAVSFPRYFNATRIDFLTKDKAGLLAPRLAFESTRLSAPGNGNRSVDLILLLLDSKREQTQKIGSKYEPPLLHPGDCVIPASVATYLGLQLGDNATVTITMSSYLSLLHTAYKAGGTERTDKRLGMEMERGMGRDRERQSGTVAVTCRVASTFDSLGGKVAVATDDDYMWMELSGFLRYLSTQPQVGEEEFRTFLRSFDPYSVVSSMLANHPARETVYLDSDFMNVQMQIAEYSSRVLDLLGFYPVRTTMPILKSLLPLSLGSMFLKIILNLVVVLLAAISCFLIYSLLMISVETRAFEMGICRMLGISKYGLGFMVIVQALLFVVPAFVLALLLSFPLLGLISGLFETALGFTFTPVPSGISVAWAIGIGLVVPLAASYLPIRQILKQSLIQSLDTTHSKTQGVHISVDMANRESNWGFLGFGTITIVFGLSIYYFLPLSLLSMNVQLMLWIMLSILLAIIVGLVIISLNIQHIMERLLVWVLLFYEQAAMKALVIKNMVAHKFRNRRTGIIYSMSLGFLLFAVVAYSMELRNTELTMLQKHASYLEVTYKSELMSYRDVIELEQVLLQNLTHEVKDFAWTPTVFSSSVRTRLRGTYITDFGKQKTYNSRVYAVPPNYVAVGNKEFLSVFQTNESSDLSLSEQLYTPRGSQGMGAGSYLERKLEADVMDAHATYQFLFERSYSDIVFESRPLFLLSSCPGQRMSRTGRAGQSVLLSYPLYLKLANVTSTALLSFEALTVTIRNDDLRMYERVYGVLNQLALQHGKRYVAWSYSNESRSTENVKLFLDILFVVVIILFMFLSFFSLSSSMTANILEQAKELSVLRAAGLTRVRTVIMYVYEAFILVLSSSLIGAIIGMMVGYTLSLQRELFTDLPISFQFPYLHLLAMFITAVICAFLSTVSPALYLLRRPIAELVKS